MGKIPVKGEKEQGRDGIGFMADNRQKYIWVYLQAVQKKCQSIMSPNTV